LAIDDVPVTEHLSQHDRDVDVRALNVLEDDHGMRTLCYGGRQLTLVIHVSQLQSDQARQPVVPGIARHVEDEQP